MSSLPSASQVGEQISRINPLSKIERIMSKKGEVVAFSSIAIALYGYDQGMMSLINTNKDYLATMGIAEEDIMVSVIVSVYYLGCAVGAVMASALADWKGRRPSILACLLTTVLGNFMMFMSGLGWSEGPFKSPLALMLVGRTIMGLGVGGIDAVIPVYSSELSESGDRGVAMAKEFQANILGLNIAFGLNLAVTVALGKQNEWAWRIPIIFMDVFPVLLLLVISRLPESPRWCIFKDKEDKAKEALAEIYGEDDAKEELDELKRLSEEASSHPVRYFQDMLKPGGSQFHPTVVTIMGQVNQALTGYGAISVYGPQIFELLGFSVRHAEYITMGNYVSYLGMMTFAWLLIDRLGRRTLMVWCSVGLTATFILLSIFGGLVQEDVVSNSNWLAAAIPGSVTLYISTALFGIGWLVPPWLIPTELYHETARSKGAAISVIIWGLANFGITFVTPPIFNGLGYKLFIILAATNLFAGWWTYSYTPETGGRSFEENVAFFDEAKDHGTWQVKQIKDGEYQKMPGEKEKKSDDGDQESSPLLGR